MALRYRLATPADHPRLEKLLIDSFEPITWFRKVDERFGPLNGRDWRARWRDRLAKVFSSQTILVGEADGEIVACATGTLDSVTLLGYIDLLAVDQRYQRQGYGREMLRAMLAHMKDRGMVHANLDCLSDNDAGNSLYRSEGFEEVGRQVRWFIRID